MAGRWLSSNLAEYRWDPQGFLERDRRELGPMAGYRLGPFSSVLVSDPTVLKDFWLRVTRNSADPFRRRCLGIFLAKAC
jgi:hypothetical protein